MTEAVPLNEIDTVSSASTCVLVAAAAPSYASTDCDDWEPTPLLPGVKLNETGASAGWWSEWEAFNGNVMRSSADEPMPRSLCSSARNFKSGPLLRSRGVCPSSSSEDDSDARDSEEEEDEEWAAQGEQRLEDQWDDDIDGIFIVSL